MAVSRAKARSARQKNAGKVKEYDEPASAFTTRTAASQYSVEGGPGASVAGRALRKRRRNPVQDGFKRAADQIGFDCIPSTPVTRQHCGLLAGQVPATHVVEGGDGCGEISARLPVMEVARIVT